MRSNKGINLVTLSIAIIILVVITSVLVYSAKDGVRISNLEKMYNDIEMLNSKVNSYYLENKDIPKGDIYCNAAEENNIEFINRLKESDNYNPNDGNIYYVLDLKLLDGVSLNYGKDYDYVSNGNLETLTDLYVINGISHTIYYVAGVQVENVKYYTNKTDYSNIELKVIPIYTAEQLATIAKVVNSGVEEKVIIEEEGGEEYLFTASDIYSIQNDIDLSSVCYRVDGTPENDVSWTPIGTISNTFKGAVLGNNHEIKNIYINNNEEISVGLFGYTENAKITNLGITGEIITTTVSGNYNGGGITAFAYGDIYISGCYNKVNVNKKDNMGSVGGIIGGGTYDGTKIIKNCYNTGNISGTNNAGGIVGYLSAKIDIDSCYNTGEIKSNNAGGLVGRNYSTVNDDTLIKIKNSYNTGYVEGKTSSGGILGYTLGTLEMENNYNKGTVANTQEHITSSIMLGGIVGHTINKATIKNCYNEAIVKVFALDSKAQIAIGGIIGLTQGGASVHNCHNTGEIVGGNRTAGIIGLPMGNTTYSGNIKILNCYNLGSINSNTDVASAEISDYTNRAAGICGMSWHCDVLDIVNCYNKGNVTAYKGRASGILDAVSYGIINIYNCYNIGDLKCETTGTSAGIVGQVSNNEDTKLNAQNIYNAGSVDGGNLQVGIAYCYGDAIPSVSNVYYIDNVSEGIRGAYTDESIKMTEEQLKEADFVDTLNNNLKNISSQYELSTWKYNSGKFPSFNVAL